MSKKKLTSKSLALLSLVLVLLIVFGIFLGLEWRKSSDVGVASDGTNAYVPNYKPSANMPCDFVAYGAGWYNATLKKVPDYIMNSLVNLGWKNNSLHYPFLYDERYPEDDLREIFPETANLGPKSIIVINYSSGRDIVHYMKSDSFKNKVTKGIQNGVKFLLMGTLVDTYNNPENQEAAISFFKLFGLDIRQEDRLYEYPIEHRGKNTYEAYSGYMHLIGKPKNLAYIDYASLFYNINHSDFNILYQNYDDQVIAAEFPTGNNGSVVRILGASNDTFPFNDKVHDQDGNNSSQSINNAYEFTARMFSCAPYKFKPTSFCTNFEALPSNGNAPKDQLKVSKQFSSEGFRFSLSKTKANGSCPTLPQIAVKGGKGTAFLGYGEGAERRDNPHPDDASSVGSRFLTDDGTISKSACQLNVAILPNFRSNRIEFDMIDVDYRQSTKAERFNVVAYGAKNKRLKTVKTPIIDNPSKSYKVVVEATEPIFSLKIVPIGTVASWGVAYDNFCSVK